MRLQAFTERQRGCDCAQLLRALRGNLDQAAAFLEVVYAQRREFLGITFVADSYGLVAIDVPTTRTVISQVAAQIYGNDSVFFYAFQAFTALILFLAAN